MKHAWEQWTHMAKKCCRTRGRHMKNRQWRFITDEWPLTRGNLRWLCCRTRGGHPKNRQWQFFLDSRGNQQWATRGRLHKNRCWRFFLQGNFCWLVWKAAALHFHPKTAGGVFFCRDSCNNTSPCPPMCVAECMQSAYICERRESECSAWNRREKKREGSSGCVEFLWVLCWKKN